MFIVPSSLTVQNAKAVSNAGLQAIASGQTNFDLSALVEVDSAAVATLVGWQRAASVALDFGSWPANLSSLAELYGVAALLRPEMTRPETTLTATN